MCQSVVGGDIEDAQRYLAHSENRMTGKTSVNDRGLRIYEENMAGLLLYTGENGGRVTA